MIDLHTHILPEIDDGSKSVKMSLEMLRRSAKQGVSAVALTPHFYPTRNTPERFLEQRTAALERLGQLPEGLPQLILGAEVTYYDGMCNSQELLQLQLGDTGLLLVEMPFGKWSSRMIQELEHIQLNLGLRPVLAHIDRYQASEQFPKYRRWLEEQQVLLQCNAEALLGFFTRRRALKLIEQGKIDFLGSDAHNLGERAPNMDRAAQVITNKLGQVKLDRITTRGKDLLGL